MVAGTQLLLRVLALALICQLDGSSAAQGERYGDATRREAIRRYAGGQSAPVIAGHMGFAVQNVYNWWDEWIATGGYGVRSRDTEVYLMTNAHWCATLCEPLLSRRRRPR